MHVDFFFFFPTPQISIGRFVRLVDTFEGMVAFKARYRISNGVELQHCELGEWLVMNKPAGSVLIPIIAFIEGGMEIPIGRVTRDFLMNNRLTPTQCSPYIFRVLGSIDMINQKIGTNLTWHDVNWLYNCQKGKETKYYIKCRVAIRLISCMLKSNKEMDKNFLILSGDGHHGLHCPTQEGESGRVPTNLRCE